MKVPYSWLREYCDPGVPPEQLADRLVMTGTEVERIGVAGPPKPDNFVVGKVLAAEQHPDADRLRVCTVDDGAVSSARSSAAPPTSPPARPSPSPCPGRGCQAARSCARRSCAGSPRKG